MNITRPNLGLSWQEMARWLALPITWIAGISAIAIWLGMSSAALAPEHKLGLAVIAMVPALVQLALYKFHGEDWAEAASLLIWTALAVGGMALAGNLYSPLMALAILPVIASLGMGKAERVLEAGFLACLAIIAMAIAGPSGWLPRDGFLLSAWPQMEMSVLVLTMVASVSVLLSLLPGWDEEARTRDSLFRNGAHMDFCVQADGRIVTASNAGRKWSKNARSLAEITGTGRAATTLRTAVIDAMAYGASLDAELPIGADEILYQIHVRPLDRRRAIVSIRDVQADHDLVTRLRSERDSAEIRARDKAVFLASMSHELRTPLNAIVGFSDMMKARLYGPIPAKYAEYADLIHESGRHLVDLVGDVLDMSKIESDHYQLSMDEFDLCDIIRSCTKLMQMSAETAGVSLNTQLPEFELPVKADRKAMRQILFNLLSNAIKFTPTGGEVTISAQLIGDDKVQLGVEDNGVGMSAEDAARVGQPFQQADSAKITDARGSGLGLSLVKALTELHEGEFVLESEHGQGTRIALDLPIVDDRKVDRGQVERMDVRAHIARAQAATQEIAAVSQRLAGGN